MKSLLIVGTGSIGRRHIENFSKYFERVEIVDTNPDRIEQAKSLFKISSSFTDYREALSSVVYDAVAITAPPHIHLPVALEAASKGAHLFIEKPLGISVEGWKEVRNLCKEKRLIAFVAYCHRFIPYTEKFKELVDSGRIGRVVNANVRWGSYLPDWHPYEDYRSFYMAKKEEGGGALLDESHGIDLMRYILGEISQVFGIVDTVSDLEISSDDTAFLTFRFENNVVAQVNFDLQARYPRVNFEVVGTEGTVIWDRVQHEVKIYEVQRKSWEVFKFTVNDVLAMYPRQAEHFIKCLQGEEEPMISLKDAMQTQKVIDAAFESGETGKLISLT